MTTPIISPSSDFRQPGGRRSDVYRRFKPNGREGVKRHRATIEQSG
jgi:hypothetical protein